MAQTTEKNPTGAATSSETATTGSAAPPRGVFVQLEENGSFTVNPMNIEMMTIPVLLRLVAKSVEQQLGL
jgi:hypothetical protein